VRSTFLNSSDNSQQIPSDIVNMYGMIENVRYCVLGVVGGYETELKIYVSRAWNVDEVI
jgi:hypothetical protein